MTSNYLITRTVGDGAWLVCERSTDHPEGPYPVYIALTKHRSKEAAEQYIVLMEQATEKVCEQLRAQRKKE